MNTKEVDQKDLYRHFRQTALIFLILIGTSHLLTGLMAGEGWFLPVTNTLNQALDIPFAVLTVFFALTNIPVAQGKGQKAKLIVAMLLLLLILLLMLYITLLVPNKV